MIPIIIFFVVLLIILSDALIKPSVFKYMIMNFSAIFAFVIGFNYYEMLAAFMIEKDYVAHISLGISFLVITAAAFAVFKIIGDYVIRKEIKFPDKILRFGTIAFSIVFAYLATGFILIFLALMPISPKYPYQRVNEVAITTDSAGDVDFSRSILNSDGAVAGIFSLISGGSMSSGQSFAVLHDNFVTNCYLNRHKVKYEDNPISSIAPLEAIRIDRSDRNTVRRAPENLMLGDNRPLPTMPGLEPYVVRAPFNLRALQTSELNLLMSQVRLICSSDYENPFEGSGKSIYPYGYLRNNRVTRASLSQIVEFERTDTGRPAQTVSLVFYVPTDMVPVAIGYRQNFITDLPQQPTDAANEGN